MIRSKKDRVALTLNPKAHNQMAWQAVGMDKKDLVVTLQSLACGKTKANPNP